MIKLYVNVYVSIAVDNVKWFLHVHYCWFSLCMNICTYLNISWYNYTLFLLYFQMSNGALFFPSTAVLSLSWHLFTSSEYTFDRKESDGNIYIQYSKRKPRDRNTPWVGQLHHKYLFQESLNSDIQHQTAHTPKPALQTVMGCSLIECQTSLQQQYCRGVCQISERLDKYKFKSRGIETSRDLAVRRFTV